jgi:hypothetical protein
MEYALQLSLWFGLGVILQAVLLVKHKWELFLSIRDTISEPGFASTVLITFLVGSVGVIGDSMKLWVFNLQLYVIFYFLFFALLFAVLFRDEISSSVNESTVLSYNIIFWFVYLNYLFPHMTYATEFAVLGLIPTVATIVVSFNKVPLNLFWSIVFHVWSMIITILIILSYVPFGYLSFFFTEMSPAAVATPIKSLSPADAVLTGMVFLYLSVNLCFIYNFTPTAGLQTFGDRLRSWTKHGRVLILLFEGGSFLVNYYLRFLPDYMLINIWILLAPQLVKLYSGVGRPDLKKLLF